MLYCILYCGVLSESYDIQQGTLKRGVITTGIIVSVQSPTVQFKIPTLTHARLLFRLNGLIFSINNLKGFVHKGS